MFKQLFSALKSGDVLDRAFSEFSEMLDHAEWMFIRANEVLTNKVEADEVRETIYRRDQSINELTKAIRRKIVRHLTINPGSDIAASLALMSVAKDAERIGDYCKNVFEVGRFYTEDFQIPKYHDPLDAIEDDVENLFTLVRECWRESDGTAAAVHINVAAEIKGRCEEVVEMLLTDKAEIQTHEAVGYSLLARHYKRVAAHLSNICTAVLGRIEDLDFRS